ncbi:MAG: formylglycine-generating enzyme family protein, partial [Pseudomonadota bacterium]
GPRKLAPGSYLITATADNHYRTAYPFALERGEDRQLDIVLPRASEVPAGYVYVPAGRFLFGSDDDESTRKWLDTAPAHELELPAFLIGRTEATYAEYLAFLRALPAARRAANLPRNLSLPGDGHCISPGGTWLCRSTPQRAQLRLQEKAGAGVRLTSVDEGERFCPASSAECFDWLRFPAMWLSHAQARAYAAWLGDSGRLPGARLCTDLEWERAGRGADARRFPHGNLLEPPDACTMLAYGNNPTMAQPCEAGTHPASRSVFGVEDLVGNVTEWTASSPAGEQHQAISRGSAFMGTGLIHWISNVGVLPTSSVNQLGGIRICTSYPRPTGKQP